MPGLSPVAASGGHSSSRCVGLSLSRPLLLRSTSSRCVGSVVVAHGPSCSATCGIFPDQGSNPCPLHWQADSQPLPPPGKPHNTVLRANFTSYSMGRYSSSFFPPLLSIFVFKTLFPRVCSTMLCKGVPSHVSLGNTYSTLSHSRQAGCRLENQGLQKCCRK